MTRRPGMVLGSRCPLYHGRTSRHWSTHDNLPSFPSNSLLLALFRATSRHRRAVQLTPALALRPAPRPLPSLQTPQEEEHRKTAANLHSRAPSASHSPTHGCCCDPFQGWLSCRVLHFPQVALQSPSSHPHDGVPPASRGLPSKLALPFIHSGRGSFRYGLLPNRDRQPLFGLDGQIERLF